MMTMATACFLLACSQTPTSQNADGVQTSTGNGALLDPQGNFTLHVSNQSFAITPVDIKVEIDGQVVVSRKFSVGNQHNWKTFKLALEPGLHHLYVSSIKGQAELSRNIQVTGQHWAVIDYWYYPDTHYNPTPKKFSFNISDEPVYFQ
jgi:hypothetical protein